MLTAFVLREARLRAGVTQRQLAERVGTTQSSIARWETGGARPPLETLAALVRACGLELRLGLAEADAGEEGLLESSLSLTPGERLDRLVRTVRFIEAGRMAMERELERA